MTSPDLFWPTNYNLDFWPYRFWQVKEASTGGAPDFKIYKKIVAAPGWSGAWR